MSGNWHGWSLINPTGDTTTYNVGYLPGRKSVCLYRIDESIVSPVAFFREESEARRFLDFLDGVVEAPPAAWVDAA